MEIPEDLEYLFEILTSSSIVNSSEVKYSNKKIEHDDEKMRYSNKEITESSQIESKIESNDEDVTDEELKTLLKNI
ncbi:37067_t:CDS:1, partial [Gigaspora margarita]